MSSDLPPECWSIRFPPFSACHVATYFIEVHAIFPILYSLHESHGFRNPSLSFKWCVFASASSGTAPRTAGAVKDEAYKAATTLPPDIMLLIVDAPGWGVFCLILARCRQDQMCRRARNHHILK